MNEQAGCVIAFFGIDRRLDLTVDSIERQIVGPAREHFDTRLVATLWAIKSIQNERSAESGEIPAPRVHLLPDGEYSVEEPPDVGLDPLFERLRQFGDYWEDGFRSLSNLYSQLLSLKRVTEMALRHDPHCVVFARPDLLYHDTLAGTLRDAKRARTGRAFIPHWQPHGGFNDRFAICVGTKAIRAYGRRLDDALAYCSSTSQPLHAERLLRFALGEAGVATQHINPRASRMRINGNIKAEDFSRHGWKPWMRGRLGAFRKVLQW